MDPNSQPPQAPGSEAMDQIRQRRIAHLARLSEAESNSNASNRLTAPSLSTNIPLASDNPSSSASPSNPTPISHPTQTPPPERKVNTNTSSSMTTPTQTSFSTRPNPFAQLRVSPLSTSGSGVPTPLHKTNALKPTESLADYTDRILRHIFRVILEPPPADDKSSSTDSRDPRPTFLLNLSDELRTSSPTGPLKLSTDQLDAAILEAASALPHSKPLLDYLLPCWKRVVRVEAGLPRPASPEKDTVVKEARRLCFSYCILALTVPDLFGREANPRHDSLAPYLLKGFGRDDDGFCLDFIQEALSRFDEDDTIEPLFTSAMVKLSGKLSSMSMNDAYKSYVDVLLVYSRFPALIDALARHPSFTLRQPPAEIERRTLLGPFFRISPLQPEVMPKYFPNPQSMDKQQIHLSQTAMQATLAAHQTDLKTIVTAFIRTSVEARGKTLDWFAMIVNANHKRRALQVHANEVASDGFMINVTVALDSLCDPFMDATFSKVNRIDINYFRMKPRVDIRDETKLNADQNQSDAFYAQTVEGTPNFITEVFFLTLAAHHYGSEAAHSAMHNLEKDIKFYERHIRSLEDERASLAGRPHMLAHCELSIQRYTAVLERALSLKHSITGVLLDEKMQSRSLLFMRYVSIWLLRTASQSNYRPDAPLTLPLPTTQPEAWQCLPEYVLQDVVDNFKFIFNYLPQIVVSAVGTEMVALCVAFLESSEYVRNPYLKSSLVSLLFSGTLQLFHLSKGVLGDLLTNSSFAHQHLLHALMKFYIEAETTGAHTQFYDKFNIRYEIFQVIKCIWVNDVYKQQLTQQSKANRPFFVRFVNLLMNDATYVLDEALGRFPIIHRLQQELARTDLEAAERETKEEELRTAEGQAQSYMQLANETLAMMKLFTDAMSDAFTMPEIVQRLALMLDYNLDTLTPPNSSSLRVQNPEKYFFQPRKLLPEIVDIYLNLSGSQAFIEAVAADGRSYKAENMAATARILRGRELRGPDAIEAWERLAERCAAAKAAQDQADLDYGEVPGDFEDPIMGDLMKDPVELPSKHIVDRSTIAQHLLSDPKDPFTRVPMTIDDVKPVTELRERIEAWKTERRAAAAARAQATLVATAAEVDASMAEEGAMDTSE